jgi:hypothetical protein
VKNERRKCPTSKESITGVIRCGEGPRTVSAIEIATNEKSYVVLLVKNVLRRVPSSSRI